MMTKQAVNLFTLGFTKKSAQFFFETLISSGIKRIIDIRLNNTSQLAGFAKQKDLEYFLKRIGGIEYIHIADLTPTKDILDAYRKNDKDWGSYEKKFLDLMSKRQIEKLQPDLFNQACLLCSEDKPHHCHRRLVAEYLKDKWGKVDIYHL